MTANFTRYGDTDPLGQQAVQQILDQGLCASAAYYAEADSTNSLALREAHAADRLPRLILADQQTSGRGRLGRQWFSDQGTLTFSLRLSAQRLLLPSEARPLVALAAGMGVADALQQAAAPTTPMIKWPNDIYLSGKKVAGLLVETSGDDRAHVVIGIGINVATEFTTAPAEVQQRATSIATEGSSGWSRYSLLPIVVQQVFERIDQLSQARPEFLTQFRQRCYLTGRKVRVRQPERSLEGTVSGITDSGLLELATPTGITWIHAGEIELLH